MRYPASEKLEIIRIVEQSHLPAKRRAAAREREQRQARQQEAGARAHLCVSFATRAKARSASALR